MSGGQRVRVRISEWALEAEAGLWQEELGKTEVYLRKEMEKKGHSKVKYQILQEKMSQTLHFTLLYNARIKECSAK